MSDHGKVWFGLPNELFPSLPKTQETYEDSSNERRLWVEIGQKANFKLFHPPKIDLILALPRPLRLEKILTMVACMGVHRLVLVNAKKVEKDYFGSHLLRDQRRKELNQLLLEGLSQGAIDYHLPQVHICRYFNSTVFSRIFGSDGEKSLRLIAHPQKGDGLAASSLISLVAQHQPQAHFERVIVAVGPEGGWEDSEIRGYEKQGFQCFHLGPRILRTDYAVSDVSRFPLRSFVLILYFVDRSILC